MEYCACGTAAVSRCTNARAHTAPRPMCQGCERVYPSIIADLLNEVGLTRPPIAKLCRPCYINTVDRAAPVLAERLMRLHGSVERVAVHLTAGVGWRGDLLHVRGPEPYPIYEQIITACAGGMRPAWLNTDAGVTLAGIYAQLTRSRGLLPPVITFEHRERNVTRTLLGKRRFSETSTPLGQIRAWKFTYHHLGGVDYALIGILGGIITNRTGWAFCGPSRLSKTSLLPKAEADFSTARMRLETPARQGEGPLDLEVVEPLKRSIKGLL